MILIYTFNNKLLIHSNQIIHRGIIQVIDTSGNLVKRLQINNKVFNTYPLNVTDGKYLIKIKSDEEDTEKHVYVTN